MRLSNGVLIVLVFIASFVNLNGVITKRSSPGFEVAGKQAVDAHKATASQFLSWKDYTLIEKEPSMEVLLLRLQEIQARLEAQQSDKAKALSESLIQLSMHIRQSFDASLFAPYAQLTLGQKKSYTDVMALILDLEEVVNQSAIVNFTPKVVI